MIDVEAPLKTYEYPPGYSIKNVTEQIHFIGDLFGLNKKKALEYAKNLPALPKGAEGWFVFPKKQSLKGKGAKKLIITPLSNVVSKIKKKTPFKEYGNETAIPIVDRTRNFLNQIESQQPGDIIIIAGQLGYKYQNKSPQDVVYNFQENEFGMDILMGLISFLVHPERYTSPSTLNTDLIGNMHDGNSKVPFMFYIESGELGITSRPKDDVYSGFAPATFFT